MKSIHVDERDAELTRLREQNELLLERVAQLDALLFVDDMVLPVDWGLTKLHKIVLRLLIRWPLVTNDVMMAALYRELDSDHPSEFIVRTQVCRLRRVLRPMDVHITTHVREGYSLTTPMRERLLALIKQSTGETNDQQ